MTTRKRPWALIIGGLVITLAIAAIAAYQLAIHSLRGRIEKALGPSGEVKEIRVGLTAIEMLGIRIRASRSGTSPAWPAEDELRAERIRIVPSLMDLLSAKIVINSIRIEGAYLSVLRTKNGQMKVLPGLAASPATSPAPSPSGPAESSGKTAGVPLYIGRIELLNASIDFFDATLRKTPVKLRLEQIYANIGNIRLPELSGQSPVNIDGVLKGVRQDGKILISGSLEGASMESSLTTKLRGVDLVVLQPYLLKAAETGVRKGSLDLDLTSSVRKGRLHAPGTLTLSDLELASGSPSATVMGVPRNALLAMMKGKKGRISVKFVLEGHLDDPAFSLNENFAGRIGSSLANVLGVSIEGLARGLSRAGSGTASSVSDSLNKILKQ